MLAVLMVLILLILDNITVADGKNHPLDKKII